MKIQTNISGFKRSLFFLLGIFVAVFVICQEVVSHHSNQICEEIIQAEEESEEAPKQDIVYSLTSQVILPISGIELEPFQAILIGEVIRETEEKMPFLPEVTLYDSPHFKTLFRQFQSPNAP